VRIADTHAHIYSPDEARYPMVAQPLRPPAGTGTVEHLRREMAAVGVQRVVAIHTSTAYRWDNRFLADSAAANAPWMVGCCTLDPEEPSSPATLRRLVETSNVRAMRSLPAGGHLDHPGVHALWRTAEELGITINVLIHSDLADEPERMLPSHAPLNLVVDHCMYPKGRDGLNGATLQRMLRLARYPNVHAKLTWLVESSDQLYPFEDTHPLLRAVIDAYGPERCIWGSDFPLELWTPTATYAQHLEVFTQQLGLSAADLEAILWRTPGRLYFRE
jgi:predicted TIM-barrel fold metal-dependent hydrolase